MNQFHDPKQDVLPTDSVIESDVPMQDIEKKQKQKRLFQRGCQWMGLGVMILGLNFGITFMLFQSDKSFLVIMYIMTSIGAACTIKGMVDIFG